MRRIAFFKHQELEILRLEARLFNKILEKFHHTATDAPRGAENIFWNEMCKVRHEYIKELENIDD